nr:hypothetical protein [Tanacetum cinerariifolium]
MDGFKMDYFKGMSYDDIRPIFEKYFNSIMDFLEKSKDQLEEEESRALKRTSESLEEKATKKQKLDEEVEELKKHLQIVPNDDDDVYTEATPFALKIVEERFASLKPKNFLDDFLLTTLTYMFEKPNVKARVWKNQTSVHDDLAGREKISIDKVHFRADAEQCKTYCCWYKLMPLVNAADSRLRLLEKNDAVEDLEALWSLVKERFSTTKPKNFSNDFLLITLGAMFEKPYIHAQVWKNQRSVHGPAKVKGWKLLKSCGVQIITFSTTQLILLVERNFGVDAAQGIQEKHAKCLMLLVKDLVLPSQNDVVD